MHTETMQLPPVVQWLALLVAIVMIASLIRLGETSLAVGLIPHPWDKLAHAATFGTIAFSLWLALGTALADRLCRPRRRRSRSTTNGVS
jgi:hypothetical protein